MAFTEETIDKVFARTGGKCECTRQHEGHKSPHHGGRCPRAVLRYGLGEPHHIKDPNNGGSDSLENCEYICYECKLAIQAPVPSVR